jgi:hypothetical protein
MNETQINNSTVTSNNPINGSQNLNKNTKVCNICGADFVHKSRFDRFCDDCRDDDELYHSVEWATYS